MQLTSLGRGYQLEKLLEAPFNLHSQLLKKLKREAENAAAGKPAAVIAKFNSLTEPQLIQALYSASMAGVNIDLIIRGICCLRPGVDGISDNIRVRSVVGRFLEHTRVFYFENNGEPEVFCSSADWMERNMFRRVEIAFPIEVKKLRDRVIKDLSCYLNDNCQSSMLMPDGRYKRMTPDGREPYSAQMEILRNLAENV